MANYRDLRKRKAFVEEYLDRFSTFVEKNNFDTENYTWLTEQAYIMQVELGPTGKVDYRPPFENYMIRNYDVILNFLPEIRRRKTVQRISGPGRVYQEQVAIFAETLIRYRGLMNSWLDESAKQLRNPFLWLREGVQSVLLLPLLILHWLGVLSLSFYNRVEHASVFRIFSGLITFVGLMSAIFTIALGWDQFITLVTVWWQRFF